MDRLATCLQFRNISSQSVSAQRVSGKTVRAFAAESSMKLELVKKPGAVRILTPAPTAGSATAPAKVKSTTRVRMIATKGAVCALKTNSGKVVGKATSKGKTLSIKPSANAYVGAKTLQATCKAKSGDTFTSNKVKIKLG
jgi:hypothetical protein